MPHSREWVVLILLAAAGAWMAVSLVQQLVVSQRLNAQAAQIRSQNATLRGQNDAYRRDIAEVNSGAAAEEEARTNGYARPDERLYLVGAPPPTPAPVQVTVTAPTPAGPVQWLGGLLARFHNP